jgi:hypothetical protein
VPAPGQGVVPCGSPHARNVGPLETLLKIVVRRGDGSMHIVVVIAKDHAMLQAHRRHSMPSSLDHKSALPEPHRFGRNHDRVGSLHQNDALGSKQSVSYDWKGVHHGIKKLIGKNR